MHVRPATPEDCAAIDALGTRTYPAQYFEGTESFRSKILGNITGCWVAEEVGQVIGYLISFPYKLGVAYPINATYRPINNPDCYYIHDLCVDSNHRGKGAAKLLAEKARNTGWPVIGLVAVLNSRAFWEKQGFVVERSLLYCELPAHYMTWRHAE